MAFKLLIVEDEPIIRRGLQFTIPWEEYDVEVIETACDGADAMQKVRDHENIDLVITDVRMPNVDGLALAQFLSTHYSRIKIIIISGYDEFSYAQQAMQSGVQDYLLKPVDVDKLLRIVLEMTNEILEQQRELKQVRQTNLKNAIYHQIFDYSVTLHEPEPYESLKVYPFISTLKEYACTTKDKSDEALTRLTFSWKETIEKRLKSHSLETVSAFTNENMLLSCITNSQGQDLSPEKILNILHESASDLPFSFHFVLFETEIKLGDLNAIYACLRENIQYLPIKKQAIICPIRETIQKSNHSVPNGLENELLTALFQSQKNRIPEMVRGLFDYFDKQHFFLSEVGRCCSTIVRKVGDRYVNLFNKEVLASEFHFTTTVDVNLFNSYSQLKELLLEDLNQAIQLLDTIEADSRYWLIEKAKEYIISYYNSDIKAHEVADVINISPNYFSSIFKQRTGKNFNVYVNEIRVSKAKDLLEATPFKVHEIAEQVGYHEYKYFVEVFKRFSGVTPTQYRKLMVNKKER